MLYIENAVLSAKKNLLGQLSIQRREMTKWRRTSVLSDRRTVMLGEELMRFVDYNEDGCRKHRYRILGTRVSRKIYLRARGMHHGHSSCDNVENDIFSKDRFLLSLESDLRSRTIN